MTKSMHLRLMTPNCFDKATASVSMIPMCLDIVEGNLGNTAHSIMIEELVTFEL